MSDVIRLLPDHVANQIAAGEVILRPASVVKELMENAVDAGAGKVQVIIKDAGKTLIQVIDDGMGMSEPDARMCFERHATSKIQQADDLFAIKTMGFRGEALASIAAIAQVELKTRIKTEELGTEILIEGSQVIHQIPCSTSPGTTFSVKNLFFNVPARRNFLKSELTETNQIFEEFYRVSLVHPDVQFILVNNGKEVYHLTPVNMKQRIVQLFGGATQEKLVPVGQETDIVHIKGFVGKPENARKTRGEQYFFVNGRYIRHPFFHHAVDTAYRQLIPEGYFPSYFIYLEVEPSTLDVNIHPTKTEVKFLNDKVIYSILHAAVRQGLGKYSLAPTLEFDVEQSLDLSTRPSQNPPVQPQIRINPDYNPFYSNRTEDPLKNRRDKSNLGHWDQLFPAGKEHQGTLEQGVTADGLNIDKDSPPEILQLKNRFLVSSVKSGMMIIDQQRAHERILFEKLMSKTTYVFQQQELFPLALKFPPSDALTLKELLPELKENGFGIEASVHQEETFVITAIPQHLQESEIQTILEQMLEVYKSASFVPGLDHHARMAASMARSMSIKAGKALHILEINHLFTELFSCQVPDLTPDGKPVLSILTLDELEQKFK